MIAYLWCPQCGDVKVTWYMDAGDANNLPNSEVRKVEPECPHVRADAFSVWIEDEKGEIVVDTR